MRKILIIESCPGVPHTDMGIEIAVREKELGNKVFYSPIYQNNLVWEYSMIPPTADHRSLAGIAYQITSKLLNHLDIDVIEASSSVELSMDDYEEYVINNKLFMGKWDLRTVVLSSVSATCHKAAPDLSTGPYRKVAEVFARAAISTYLMTVDLIKKIAPDLLYFYAGRWATCIPIKWACIDLGIESLSHERGSDNNKFMLYDVEAYASIEQMKRAVKKAASINNFEIVRFLGSEHFRSKRSRIETIWPSFTTLQLPGDIPANLDGKSFVCYFTSSEDEFSQIPGNKVDSYFGGQFDAFETLKNICIKLKQHLVVRVHPNVAYKHEEEERFWLSQESEHVTVIGSKSKVDTYELLDKARTVVTFATTVGMEAVYWKKPSIIIGNALWFGEEGFYCPRNTVELADMIVNATYRDAPFIYQFTYYLETFGFKLKHYRPVNFFSGKIFQNNIHPLISGF